MHQVHSKNISREQKRVLWNEIVQDFLASDLGLTKYSKQHGIRFDHLYYYVSVQKRKQVSAFIPMTLPVPIDGQIKIQFDKVSLYIPLNVSPEQLSNILKGITVVC